MAFGTFTYDARATLSGWHLYRTQWRDHVDWSSDRMADYQLRRLQGLLVDAGAHVPYYRQLFHQIGFNPSHDFRSLSDLTQLPILSKDDVRTHTRALRRHPIPMRSIIERTSGSTGEPLSVLISPSQIAVEKATVWRHWRWLGYRFRDPVAVIRTYVPHEGQPLWRYDRSRNFLYCSAYHLDRHNATMFLDRLRRFRPRFLRGYPSSLAILADAVCQSSVRLDNLKAVLTASETLTRDTRNHLSETFRAPVSDWYGLAEQVVTAAQCEAQNGLHCHDDYGSWELLPCPDQSGRFRIIGTNLHNTAMPLIRYDTGDLTDGTIDAACPCGRSLPRIGRIMGRQDDELIGADGHRIPSVNLYSVFREFPAVRRFQMIQHQAADVEVRLEAGKFDRDDRNALLQMLRERLGQGMTIRIVRNRSFERTTQGKRRTVISHVRPPVSNRKVAL